MREYPPQRWETAVDELVYGSTDYQFARWREAVECARACRTPGERVRALKTAGIARRALARLKGFPVVRVGREWA